MTTRRLLTRRQFSGAAAMAFLGGATITISGCGGSSPMAPSPGAGDKVGVISGNHGHSAVITSGQLTAGGALALNIQGSADHNHKVELSASEIVQIRDGTRVGKASSNQEGHNHTVTFN